jgi:hypothetical protein
MDTAPTSNGDAGIGLLWRTPFPAGRSCQVAAPPAAQALRPSPQPHFGQAGFALGLRLGASRCDRLVLGLQVPAQYQGVALRIAHSRLDLEGEVLIRRQQPTLLGATFVAAGRTRSPTRCGPQSRPEIDRWCDTSSGRPAAG